MADHSNESQKEKLMPTFWDTMFDELDAGTRTVTNDQIVTYYDKWAKDGSYEKVR